MEVRETTGPHPLSNQSHPCGHLRVISVARQPEFFKVDIQFELQVIHLKYNDVINTLCTISNQLVELA